MPPVKRKAGPLVRKARQSGRFAPEALRRVPGANGGTFAQRIQAAAASLPRAQARSLRAEARDFRQDVRAGTAKRAKPKPRAKKK